MQNLTIKYLLCLSPLGRSPQTQEALGLVSVDNHIPPAVLEEIRAIPAIRMAQVVSIE